MSFIQDYLHNLWALVRGLTFIGLVVGWILLLLSHTLIGFIIFVIAFPAAITWADRNF